MASLERLTRELRKSQMKQSDSRLGLIVDWFNEFYQNNPNCYLAIRMDSNPIQGEEPFASSDGYMDAYPIHDMRLDQPIPTIDKETIKKIIKTIADTTATFSMFSVSKSFCIFLTRSKALKYDLTHYEFIGHFGRVLQRTDMLKLMCFDLHDSLIKKINKDEDETESYIELFHYLITNLYNYTQRVRTTTLNNEDKNKSHALYNFSKLKLKLKYKFRFIDLKE